MDVIFQQMALEDIDQVAIIEQQSPSPWNKDVICVELSKENSFQYVLVDKARKKIIAWCAVLVVAGEADLLKIAVHSTHRRCRFGSEILKQLVNQLSNLEVEKIFLEVRSKNVAACRLYEKHQFREVSQRKNYYKNPQDDALIFVRSNLY